MRNKIHICCLYAFIHMPSGSISNITFILNLLTFFVVLLGNLYREQVENLD